MRLRSAFVLAALFSLAACADPPVGPHTFATQRAATSMHSWNEVARTMVGAMERQGLLPDPNNPANSTPPERPFFVHVTVPGSAFLAFVKDSLETEIMDRGGRIAVRPQGATVLNLEVEAVRWSAGGTGGVAGVGGGLEALRSGVRVYGAEVVWQITALTRDELRFRARGPVHIRPDDLALFHSGPSIGPLASPGPAGTLPARNIRIVR